MSVCVCVCVCECVSDRETRAKGHLICITLSVIYVTDVVIFICSRKADFYVNTSQTIHILHSVLCDTEMAAQTSCNGIDPAGTSL